MKEHTVKASLLMLAAVILNAATLSAEAGADPGVFPTSSKPYGQSYGQWVVAYWQWALSIPFDTNPWANDTTGEFAAVGQSGPVWFLGGTLGDSVTREVTIPAGKAVFLPVHPWIFGASVGDCTPSNPGVACDVETLRAAAAQAAEAVSTMEVSIDTQMIQNAWKYRTLSPSAFSVTLPVGNVLGLSAGTYSPQVSDGYYLILAPLSAGEHTIALHVASTLGFEYTIVYNIKVEPQAS